MAPLRDTMCLVDGIERYLHRLEELHILLLGKRFRRNIQQLGMPSQDVRLHLVNRGFVERRVQVMRRPLMLAQLRDEVHLILHQGYQRRYDNRRSFHQERG